MWALRQRLALLALTDDFVLIQGESGTGKDLVALAIHRLSKRREGPWVPHNAANFTESLNESQLFGVRPARTPLFRDSRIDCKLRA
jgi:transcriptional regulator with GAF, ATPase, and Fis domain